MTIYSWLIIACWAVFLGYWLVTGLGSKRTAKPYARQLFARAVVAALVILVVRSRPADISTRAIVLSPAFRVLGILVCAAGIAFAISARRRLGKNWGMPMSVHESPELIMTGPYARVRHPICIEKRRYQQGLMQRTRYRDIHGYAYELRTLTRQLRSTRFEHRVRRLGRPLP